jgi:short-subunit dehydrogenase
MQQNSQPLAVVTGAASGIGRALAELLAKQGYQLFLVDRNHEGLSNLQAEIRDQWPALPVVVHCCDLSTEDAVGAICARVLEDYTELHLLINNSGIVHYGPTESMAQVDMERLMRINLQVPMQMTLRLLPRLLASKNAHLVNVASIYGIFPRKHTAAYHASKFGLLGFSESLRIEYRGRLGVTTVCPGFVSTNLFSAGTSSTREGVIPHPPSFLCNSPETVARKTWNAIRAKRGLVIVGLHAHVLYYGQRFFPGLCHWLASR